jgi:hypothetical protein
MSAPVPSSSAIDQPSGSASCSMRCWNESVSNATSNSRVGLPSRDTGMTTLTSGNFTNGPRTRFPTWGLPVSRARDTAMRSWSTGRRGQRLAIGQACIEQHPARFVGEAHMGAEALLEALGFPVQKGPAPIVVRQGREGQDVQRLQPRVEKVVVGRCEVAG